MFKLLHTYDLPTSIQIIVCVTVSTIPQYSSSILQFDIGLNSGYCAARRLNTGAQGRANNSTGEFGHHNWMLKTTLEDWRNWYNTDQHSTLIPNTTSDTYLRVHGVLQKTNVTKWRIDIPKIRMQQGSLSSITDIGPGNDGSLRTILLPVYTFKGKFGRFEQHSGPNIERPIFFLYA